MAYSLKNVRSLITIIFITFCVIAYKISDVNFGRNGNYGVVDWDNFGYYFYLPAQFIYDDLKLENIDWAKKIQSEYNLSSTFYQAHLVPPKGHVIQYTMGMAIIYSPAFFAGHGIALISDSYPSDGFSLPYQISILVYSFLIVFLGLYYLRKLALLFFSDHVSTIAILTICLGTNYLQLAGTNTSSPHVYLFGLYSCLLYAIAVWHKKPEIKRSIAIGVLLAILILSRANELLFIVIPLLWGVYSLKGLTVKVDFFIKQIRHLLIISAILALFGSFQMLYWKHVTGSWIYDSYINEDFKLLNSYLKEFLFSYKKGWLLYTPVFIFLPLGFYFLFKKRKDIFAGILLHFVLTIWVLSSWDCWWYADSFSQRSIMQSYPAFLIPMGFLIQYAEKKTIAKWLFGIPMLLCLVLNLFQTYQIREGIIHPNRMTKEYYWAVFMKTNSTVNGKNQSLLEPPRGISYLPEELMYKDEIIVNEMRNKEKLSPQKPYSKKIVFPYSEISTHGFPYIEGGYNFKVISTDGLASLGIVYGTVDHKSKNNYGYNYKEVKLEEGFNQLGWQQHTDIYAPPYLRSKDDIFEIFFWLIGNAEVEVEGPIIKSHEPTLVYNKSNYFEFGYPIKHDSAWTSAPFKTEQGSYQIDTLNPFSATLALNIGDIDTKSGHFLVKAEGAPSAENLDVFMVVSISDNGVTSYYKSFSISSEADYWTNWKFEHKLPTSISPDAELRFYLWNKSKKAYNYKRLSLEFMEVAK